MFGNDQDGAIATAVYYLSAQNWALALNDNRPVNLVCVAQRCLTRQDKYRTLKALDEHIVGGRTSYDRPRVTLARVPNGSRWLYRVHLTTAGYRVIDSNGDTVDEYPGSSEVRTNIFLKWAGKLWTVTLQATVPKGAR